VKIWIALAALTACTSPNAVECGDGNICPVDSTCVHLTAPDALVCATAAQIDACADLTDDASCTLDTIAGQCRSGACIPIACGNGRAELGEACDDGNTVTGDGCAADSLSDETCGNGSVDPLALVNGEKRPNEECDDGNLVSGDGCSSSCTAEAPRWSQLDLPMPGLAQTAMAYDSARRRIVLFGGVVETDTSYASAGGTYEWDGVRWHTITTDTAPATRNHAMLAYDPIRKRTVLFGGDLGQQYSAVLGDTWEWNGTSWTVRSPAHQPPARGGGAMVYDSAHKRIVLFGGRGGGGTYDDTWIWDGNDWTQLDVSPHPAPRAQFVMGYDPKRNVVVLAGGEAYFAGESDAYPGDTWELDGDTWAPRGASPASLDNGSSMAWDPVGQRLITYGGKTGVVADATPTMWAYDGNGWSSIDEVQPGIRYDVAIAPDPARGRVILYGGISDNGMADTWSWDSATWTQVAAPLAPPHRAMAGVATDRERGVAWVFGGNDDGGDTDTPAPTNTLMSYDGNTWTIHAPAGTPPTPRLGAGVAYDQVHHRLVVVGGADTLALTPTDTVTYLWDGSSWSTAAAGPSARVLPAMAYDPRGQRVVLYGGVDASLQLLTDTWVWNGSTWQQLSTTGSPGMLLGETMVYDEVRGTLVLEGGGDLQNGSLSNSVWELDGSTWTQRGATSPAPARFFHGAAYDAAARRVIVSGGTTQSETALGDTWSWSGDWEFVSTAESPPARATHVMFTNPSGPGVIEFGGGTTFISPGTPFADTWLLEWISHAPRESCVTSVDLDDDGLAGCADPDCWYACTPTCAPGTTCDPAAPRCGDGVCSAEHENCRICAADCACSSVCGDSFCDSDESAASCPGDCTP
jgi:cysteine-rich repeat protein